MFLHSLRNPFLSHQVRALELRECDQVFQEDVPGDGVHVLFGRVGTLLLHRTRLCHERLEAGLLRVRSAQKIAHKREEEMGRLQRQHEIREIADQQVPAGEKVQRAGEVQHARRDEDGAGFLESEVQMRWIVG